ncbi:Putative sensory transduction regulator [Pseudooceanicola antarcticus]|nr:YbjN domain-containing protein [Pseudooceanicola antarcticus]SNY57659.1 Putative sensory transduction regulator [Pseudooceanicola antarcticus]
MSPFHRYAVSAVLLAAMAQPVLAKSTGGLIGDAIGSVARAAGNGSGSEVGQGMVSAREPAGLVSLLQDLGYRAELDVDSAGDPIIHTSAAGVGFSLYFYGCLDNRDCDSLMFSAGFDRDQPMTPAQINEWNRKTVVAGAYVDDEGDPFLESYMLTGNGIPASVFEGAMDEWEYVLGDFLDFIDW